MRIVEIPRKDGGVLVVEALEVEEFKNSVSQQTLLDSFKVRQKRGNRARQYYYNLPVTFDIETSQIPIEPDKNKYFNPMYIWMMTIGAYTVYGREWKEWLELLVFLHEIMNLSDNRRCIVYIHNLSYEWNWIHKRLPVTKIFAKESRKVLRFETDKFLMGFEFRCSYTMTNQSLAKWAEDTKSCPINKMVGDLDYSVIRTPKTVLTDEEFRYAIADVVTMSYCIQDKIDNETSKCIGDIPLTATGFIRRDCRSYVRKDKNWSKFYDKLKMDGEQFILYNMAFRGGDTHAHILNSHVVQDEAYSFDITSSYPYQMIAQEYPASKPITMRDVKVEDFNYILEHDWLFIIEFELVDVKCKSYEHMTYLPLSKCSKISSDRKLDNGRVVNCTFCKTCMTNIDFKIFCDNYDFEIVSINRLVYHTKKQLLPKVFRDYILKLYGNKTKFKGLSEKESEYTLSKSYVNSLYGMTVTNPLNDEISYENNEWVKYTLKIVDENQDQITEELNQTYKSRNHFLPYEIGVFVTAYARQHLHTALSKLKSQAIYWDTDSCKFVNKENYSIFWELNKDIEYKLMQIYDRDEIAPKDIKGKEHVIGLWDEEYPDGVKFITYGSKKYFYKDLKDNSNHITVAGLNKKKAAKYLESELDNDVTNIKIGQIVPEEFSGRTFSVYVDEEMEINYFGETLNEKSYMSIVPTTYQLDDTEDYKLLLIMAKADRIVHRG